MVNSDNYYQSIIRPWLNENFSIHLILLALPCTVHFTHYTDKKENGDDRISYLYTFMHSVVGILMVGLNIAIFVVLK